MSDTIDRFRCVDVACFPLGPGRQAVRPALGTKTHVIPTSVLRVLASCASFQSIAEHTRRVRDELGLDEARAQAIAELLGQSARDGLLVSQAQLHDRIVAADAPTTAARIETLGVVTKDRPTVLARCVSSYLRNARTHGRSLAVVVMDDSSADGHRANRATLARLADEFGVEVQIGGVARKRRFEAALVASGLPRPVVEFALGNPLGWDSPIGANRNALQLLTGGQRIVSTDDDMVCSVAVPDGDHRRVALASSSRLEVRFFRSRDEMSAAANFGDADFFGIHEAVLGRSVAACLGDLPCAADYLDHAGAEFLRALASGRGRVALSESGYAGDSGTGPSTWVLGVEDEDRRRYLRTEHEYRLATSSREVIRMPSVHVITEAPGLMTGAVAFDHSRVLPPFLPAGRNEDGVFATLLRACDPDAYLAHAPLALLHAPVETRAFPADALRASAGRFSVADVVSEAIGRFAPDTESDSERRMVRLGRDLEALGSRTTAEFGAWLREFAWERQVGAVAHFTALLDQHGAEPDYWAADVRDQIARIEACLDRDTWFLPRGLPPVDSAEQAIDCCRAMMQNLGRLLQHWPEICRVATRLRDDGVSLATDPTTAD